ncbi:MAG: MBOAT family O-acyltransferase [Salibacteraceae bacterium]
MSLLFYMWGEQELVLLMIFSCVLNYLIGLWIDHSKFKKLALTAGIMANLGILGYYKYADFFVDSINKILPPTLQSPLLNIILPIGISFFTFQSISYLVDLYRNEVQVQKNPFSLALYISLFPQLIAGPIVRYQDIAFDLGHRKHSIELFNSGIRRFVLGLTKKVLIANVLAQVVDEVFLRNPGELNPYIIWFGSLCFGMQVYYDFSGYSDMAIGLGRMFGFKFLENFNYPFIAKSIQEFWQRWHISLGSWFRDYLYIPLGGNKVSTSRNYFNLIAVFFLMGLWHGANYNYIIWALYYGVFIIIERNWIGGFLHKSKYIGHLYFMFFITSSWVLFKVEDIVVQKDFYWVMFTGGINADIDYWPNNEQIIVFVLAYFFAFNGYRILQKIELKWLSNSVLVNLKPTLIDIGLFLAFLACIITLSSNSYNPFIYFRF